MATKEPYRENASCGVDHGDLEAAAYQRGIDKGRKLAASEARSAAFWNWANSDGAKMVGALLIALVTLCFVVRDCNQTDLKSGCVERLVTNVGIGNDHCVGGGHIRVEGNQTFCRCGETKIDASDGGTP